MRAILRAAWILLTAAAAVSGASAGAMHLRWDPVADTDLAGYRVFWGTSSGSYSQSRDVGNVTATVLDGLADCTTWYVAVKAYDTAGNVSASFSNEVSGWPRPVVAAVTPVAVEQGRTLTLAVTGTNFLPGATVQLGASGIIVGSASVSSCTALTVQVAVGASASIGATNVDVTNPDSVYGSGAGLLTILAATAPTVASTSPSDGATGVAVTQRPAVRFSEAMLPSSVTSSTVRLLDGTGSAVAQAAGSPALSSDGVTATIAPAADLAAGATYRIEVVGGASGVYDLANHPMAVTYRQTTGFTTVPDTDLPAISAVQSSEVTATTARIAWTTDEDADSQVFYRKSGQTGYQETAVDAAMVESHSVSIEGLAPSTTYEYYVRSADAAGNAATSSPVQTLATSPSAYSYLAFDAEGGALVSPARATQGADAFGGAWIDTPAGTAAGTATSPAGTATFGVSVPAAGTWYLWVRIYGPAASSDSWFESVDGAARQEIVAPQTGVWTWVAGRSYSLGAGLHSVELGGREAEARADRILLTDDAMFHPTEQPVDDQTPTAAAAAFTAVASDGQNLLGWRNPSDADFVRTVLRYRTDGRFPTSPVDGYAVADRPAAPGSADGFAHTGLTNGVTYSYAAFALDAAGNVAPSAQALGVPVDNVPPAVVMNVHRADARP